MSNRSADLDENQILADRLYEAGDHLKSEKGISDHTNGYYIAAIAVIGAPHYVGTYAKASQLKGVGDVLAKYIVESATGDVPMKLRELRGRADPGAAGSPGRGT